MQAHSAGLGAVIEAPHESIRDAVRRALVEDIGQGDVTTAAVVPHESRVRAEIVYRQRAIVAGLPVVREVLRQMNAQPGLDAAVPEGAEIGPGEVAATCLGDARALLTSERVALNFLQRLSGIATLTRAFVDAVAGTDVAILDTRKTTPTLRALEKYAVVVGGGTNHRMGLDDAVLVKDNHIASAGDIATAVRRACDAAPGGMRIQVEIERPDEAEVAIASGATALLLDNMSPEQIEQVVAAVQGRVPLEASGRIALEDAERYARTGVEYISVGALTHSARAVDISLEVERWL